MSADARRLLAEHRVKLSSATATTAHNSTSTLSKSLNPQHSSVNKGVASVSRTSSESSAYYSPATAAAESRHQAYLAEKQRRTQLSSLARQANRQAAVTVKQTTAAASTTSSNRLAQRYAERDREIVERIEDEVKVKRKQKKAHVALSNPQVANASASTTSTTSATQFSQVNQTEQLFYQLVLQWNIFDKATQQLNKRRAPNSADSSAASLRFSFTSASEYVAFFQPLLLSDFKVQLLQTYELNTATAASDKRLHSLILFSTTDNYSGRCGEEMIAVDLLPLTQQPQQRVNAAEWSSGMIALLEYRSIAEIASDQLNDSNSTTSLSTGDVSLKRRLNECDDERCQVVCLIDRFEENRSNSTAVSIPFSLRLSLYLPCTPSLDDHSTADRQRLERMWSAIHPRKQRNDNATDKDEKRKRALEQSATMGRFEVTLLENPTTTIREFIALNHINRLTLLQQLIQPQAETELQRALQTSEEQQRDERHHNSNDTNPYFKPSTASSSNSTPTTPRPLSEVNRCWHSLPEQFRLHTEASLNRAQMLAVKLGLQRSKQPGFTLLQGPPGTGKTKTVISLLNSLHLQTYQNYYNSFIDLIAHRIAHSHDPCIQLPSLKPKPRILVCAPSNAGVDEIISRVLGSQIDKHGRVGGGFRDGQLNFYSPDILRVGNAETMRAQVRQRISLDTLIDSYTSMTVTTVQARLAQAKSQLAKCEVELAKHVSSYRARVASVLQSAERRQLSAGVSVENPVIVSDRPSAICAREIVEPTLLQELAHIHERREQALLEIDRMQLVMELLSDNQQGDFARKKDRQQFIDQLRLSHLNTAHIVFCTLSGAGLDLLSHLDQPFQALIIDEAAQSTEMTCLVALRHNVQHCILIGDHKQLPATIFTQDDTERRLLERSLFQRLFECGVQRVTLEVQYRMHSLIRAFPSFYFYDNRLIDGDNVLSADYQRPFHRHYCLQPYMFFDVQSSNINIASRNSLVNPRSQSNETEARFICQLLEFLFEFDRSLKATQVSIITFYQAQKHLLSRMVPEVLKRIAPRHSHNNDTAQSSNLPSSRSSTILQVPSAPVNLEVSTVDSFQGREQDVIIISCVRTTSPQAFRSSIGFVADVRRLNVSITRGKWSLWIVGDGRALQNGSKEWEALIKDAQRRQCFTTAHDFMQYTNTNTTYAPSFDS